MRKLGQLTSATGLVLILGGVMYAAPAAAQVDLVGGWAPRMHEDLPERLPGPEIGEFHGLPLNDAARARGQAWSASLWTVPEHQCIPHGADYAPSFTGLRIWKDVDQSTQRTVAYHTQFIWMSPLRTIWMDGRPHPPDYALHTWQGFSTGQWDGAVLTVTTTHLKPLYVRRNGIARSEKSTVVEHYLRNSDTLTIVTIVHDPVYLTEPHIRSRNFHLDPGFTTLIPYPCDVVVEVERPEGAVPHHLPEMNPFLTEYASKHGIPIEASMGGAETMYPEYRDRLRTLPAPPRLESGSQGDGQ
jgi:hypothetical protein